MNVMSLPGLHPSLSSTLWLRPTQESTQAQGAPSAQALVDALGSHAENPSAFLALNDGTEQFTLPGSDGKKAVELLRAAQDAVGFQELLYDDRIGKVSLIGAGMRSHPGVSAKFFAALAEAGVNIGMISTSEIRISVVVSQKDVDIAVNATHKAFDLEADEVEAVVYGGSGR